MEVSKGAFAGIIAAAVVLFVGLGWFIFFRTPTGPMRTQNAPENPSDPYAKLREAQRQMQANPGMKPPSNLVPGRGGSSGSGSAPYGGMSGYRPGSGYSPGATSGPGAYRPGSGYSPGATSGPGAMPPR
jgi:hypothetical protein